MLESDNGARRFVEFYRRDMGGIRRTISDSCVFDFQFGERGGRPRCGREDDVPSGGRTMPASTSF